MPLDSIFNHSNQYCYLGLFLHPTLLNIGATVILFHQNFSFLPKLFTVMKCIYALSGWHDNIFFLEAKKIEANRLLRLNWLLYIHKDKKNHFTICFSWTHLLK